MMQIQDNEAFQMRFRTTGIIWFAMLVSIGLYALMVEAFERGWIGEGIVKSVPHGDRIHILLLAFAVMSFFLAGALKTMVLKSQPDTVEQAADRLQRATILALAVSESIVLMGLVEYFLIRRYGSFYLFVALGCLSFIVHAPKAGYWVDYARQAARSGDSETSRVG